MNLLMGPMLEYNIVFLTLLGIINDIVSVGLVPNSVVHSFGVYILLSLIVSYSILKVSFLPHLPPRQ